MGAASFSAISLLKPGDSLRIRHVVKPVHFGQGVVRMFMPFRITPSSTWMQQVRVDGLGSRRQPQRPEAVDTAVPLPPRDDPLSSQRGGKDCFPCPASSHSRARARPSGLNPASSGVASPFWAVHQRLLSQASKKFATTSYTLYPLDSTLFTMSHLRY